MAIKDLCILTNSFGTFLSGGEVMVYQVKGITLFVSRISTAVFFVVI